MIILAVLILLLVSVNTYLIIHYKKAHQRLINEQHKTAIDFINSQFNNLSKHNNAKFSELANDIDDKLEKRFTCVGGHLDTLENNINSIMITLSYLKNYLKPTIIKDEKVNKNVRILKDSVTGATVEIPVEEKKNANKRK